MFDDIPSKDDTECEAAKAPLPDYSLQRFARLRQYVKSGKIPWRKASAWKRETLCNKSLVTPNDVGNRNGTPFPLKDHRFVSNKVYQAAVKDRFLDDISNAAIHSLKVTTPKYSATSALSFKQHCFALILFAVFAAAIIRFPLTTVISINAFITLYFILAIGYRVILLTIALFACDRKTETPTMATDELPVITILLPLYKDAASLPSLAHAMEQLAYPQEKKDLKLLLEEDDLATISEAKRLRLDEIYDVIVIPKDGPRTKPKACNYGLHLARGDLIVIYDAEDQPESDQLLKAASAFRHADPSVACVQAKLNYYNQDDNWITRQFALEYSLWFDWLLPALQKIGAPIPLGGTSNFFRGIR